jgi:uncharacterized membrane protein
MLPSHFAHEKTAIISVRTITVAHVYSVSALRYVQNAMFSGFWSCLPAAFRRGVVASCLVESYLKT